MGSVAVELNLVGRATRLVGLRNGPKRDVGAHYAPAVGQEGVVELLEQVDAAAGPIATAQAGSKA